MFDTIAFYLIVFLAAGIVVISVKCVMNFIIWFINNKEEREIKRSEKAREKRRKAREKEVRKLTKEIKKQSGNLDSEVRRYNKLKKMFPYDKQEIRICLITYDLFDRIDKKATNSFSSKLKHYADVYQEKRQIETKVRQIAAMYMKIGNKDAAKKLLKRINYTER